jgi:lysophospholipase L1-like esterase
MHLVLLGDSTFDNAAYTEGGPDVVGYLRRSLGRGDEATLLAVDGALVGDVHDQLHRLRELAHREPAPTHLALSVGGNDLLARSGILQESAPTVAGALLTLAEAARGFGEAYRALLDAVLALELPTSICTVYHGAFQDPREARAVAHALRVFDHEIVEAGLDRGLPVVDLRRVCSEPADYWNPIEPSEEGGRKIAEAVARAAQLGDRPSPGAWILTGRGAP